MKIKLAASFILIAPAAMLAGADAPTYHGSINLWSDTHDFADVPEVTMVEAQANQQAVIK